MREFISENYRNFFSMGAFELFFGFLCAAMTAIAIWLKVIISSHRAIVKGKHLNQVEFLLYYQDPEHPKEVKIRDCESKDLTEMFKEIAMVKRIKRAANKATPAKCFIFLKGGYRNYLFTTLREMLSRRFARGFFLEAVAEHMPKERLPRDFRFIFIPYVKFKGKRAASLKVLVMHDQYVARLLPDTCMLEEGIVSEAVTLYHERPQDFGNVNLSLH